MVRTQIQLTEDQTQRLKAVSRRRGVSIAELIRQGVDTIILREGERSPDELRERALKAAGRFHSGRHDVSLRHDEYLAEAPSP
jgi:thiamine monophosphate synthase